MKIEIWSDIVCPFCYLGKRRLEAALAEFPHRDEVHIQWRSFELDPATAPRPGQGVFEHLAERKGLSLAQSRQMHEQMAATAAQAGLEYHFDRAVAINSFRAHQLLHLATKHGRNDAAKERLFRAYYTEGQDLADPDTLVRLAEEVGLDAAEARQALAAGTYADAVRADERRAQQLGVRGVPFFVFDEKYAVSGAQPAAQFAEVLDTVWREAHPLVAVGGSAEGAVCGPEGCD